MPLHMQHIEYLDFSYGTKEKAFLIRSDHQFCYFITPFCYEWLCFLKKESVALKVEALKIPKNFFSYYLQHEPNYFFSEQKRSLFTSFPIEEKHLPYLLSISNFAETALRTKTNRTPLQALESALFIYKDLLPPFILTELVCFFGERLILSDPKLRLKFFFSKSLIPYYFRRNT